MKTTVSSVFRRWRDEGGCELDVLHRHFKELLDRGDFDDSGDADADYLSACWIEVADEGRRVWNRMFHKIAVDSPIHGVLCAVAAAAFEAGLRGVAARLGVSAAAVERAIEGGGRPPDIEQFLRDCREADAAMTES